MQQTGLYACQWASKAFHVILPDRKTKLLIDVDVLVCTDQDSCCLLCQSLQYMQSHGFSVKALQTFIYLSHAYATAARQYQASDQFFV